ncbi:MAG TPA: isoaspartyl peptidase/L-asparaginase, partial [Acidimicrobiales bacterium]|nr:isoaspartyl peptidase/L-asparaginase [Acidimicrobiales bacterium]
MADSAGGYSSTVDIGHLEPPALVIHGGAGTFEWLRRLGEGASGRMRSALEESLSEGWGVLDGGGSALAAVVEAVASMENSGMFDAGRGSVPTTAGTIEMDAAVMEGDGHRAGAVCATTWPANPVRAALLVARLGLPSGGEAGAAGDGPRPAGSAGSAGSAGRAGRAGTATTDRRLGGAQGRGGDGGFWPLLLAGNGADEFARAAGLERMSHTTQAPRPPGAPGHGTVGAVAVDVEGHVAA